jgi:hypothetical protein
VQITRKKRPPSPCKFGRFFTHHRLSHHRSSLLSTVMIWREDNQSMHLDPIRYWQKQTGEECWEDCNER